MDALIRNGVILYLLQLVQRIKKGLVMQTNSLQTMQLQLLQNCDKASRAVIAAIALVMYDCETAELLLKHYSEELGTETCAWLNEMLNFEQKCILEDAQAAQNVH